MGPNSTPPPMNGNGQGFGANRNRRVTPNDLPRSTWSPLAVNHPRATSEARQNAIATQQVAMARQPPPVTGNYYGKPQGDSPVPSLTGLNGNMQPDAGAVNSFNAQRDKVMGPYRDPDAMFNPTVNPVDTSRQFEAFRARSLAPPTDTELHVAQSRAAQLGLRPANTVMPHPGLTGPPVAGRGSPPPPMGIAATAPRGPGIMAQGAVPPPPAPIAPRGPGPGFNHPSAATAARRPLAAVPAAPALPAAPVGVELGAVGADGVPADLRGHYAARYKEALARGDHHAAAGYARAHQLVTQNGFHNDAAAVAQAGEMMQEHVNGAKALAAHQAAEDGLLPARRASMEAEARAHTAAAAKDEIFGKMTPEERDIEGLPPEQRQAARQELASRRASGPVGPNTLPPLGMANNAMNAALTASVADEVFGPEAMRNGDDPLSIFERTENTPAGAAGLADPNSEFARQWYARTAGLVGNQAFQGLDIPPEGMNGLGLGTRIFSSQATQRLIADRQRRLAAVAARWGRLGEPAGPPAELRPKLTPLTAPSWIGSVGSY